MMGRNHFKLIGTWVLASVFLSILIINPVYLNSNKNFQCSFLILPGLSSITPNPSHFDFPPASPVLSDIAPNPNLNGTIILWWSASAGAISYNVYCYTDLITSINSSLYLVSNIGITSEIDSGLTNGTYYYAITAINASGVSNVSNCQSVTIAIPPPSSLSITATPASLNGIFYVLAIVAVITISVILAIFLLQRRKQIGILSKK